MPDYTLDKGKECRLQPTDKLHDMQTGMLRAHIRQALNSPYYKRKYHKAGITPEDISSVADLRLLPLTSREDIDTFGDDFRAVPQEKITDLSLTSGTTSMPVKIPYTTQDLDRLAYNEAMAFWGAGIRPDDTCLICVTLDRCFIAGLAYYTGLVKLGATAIRSGAGQPARQWELIRQLFPNVLIGVPTFLLQIAEWAKNHGKNPANAGIKALVTIGEPIRKPDFSLTPLGQKLSATWQSPVFSSYGATELETGTCECSFGKGGHVHPELSLVEIINDQGKPVPDGEAGELVFTPLGVQGFPLIRFRTGDISRKYQEPCPCGWQTARLGPIEGRIAQRLKYRGTTIYPDSIFQVLQEFEDVKASFIEVRSAYDLSDDIRIVVGCDTQLDKKELEAHLQARLRVRPEVEKKSIAEVVAIMTGHGGRKPKKFFDLRC
jgi:phenylacetate-CoA ligase